MKRGLFISLFFLCSFSFVDAHIPLVVEQKTLHDIVTIDEPEVSQAFYGAMQDFPHTYEIRAQEPFHLFVQVLVPDISSSKNIVSGIIIKEKAGSGRVEEVARLLAKDAAWESFFEPWGGDSYRSGGTFEKDVPAGVYRIEVSTPNNQEKYVLVVGKKETFGTIGYFETIGRISDVKVFFGKSRILIIESPLVYIPLSIILLGVFMYWYFKRHPRSMRETGEV